MPEDTEVLVMPHSAVRNATPGPKSFALTVDYLTRWSVLRASYERRRRPRNTSRPSSERCNRFIHLPVRWSWLPFSDQNLR